MLLQVRSAIEQLDFPVLELARRDAPPAPTAGLTRLHQVNPADPFFPADDRLPGDNQAQAQP